MRHGRPSPLRPNHMVDDIERGCGCPACFLGYGWRRQHAQCVWQAMQAVVAFAALGTAMSYGSYTTSTNPDGTKRLELWP